MRKKNLLNYSKNITTKQKQILGLLSIGTFLEYFDLTLYIHMMLFLNEIFFPPVDRFNALWLSAFTFCSSYILRPFGAIILGIIGDRLGRKPTIVIATFMMAFSCIVMAITPAYNQIGILASVIITICRAIQGISSIAEFTGAQLYLTETFKPPLRYLGVMLIPVASVLGTTIALSLASKVLANHLDWRYLFWFGGFIALIGLFARTKLVETTQFISAKNCLIKKTIEQKEPQIRSKTMLAMFFIHSTWPVCYYFCYIYCGNILKHVFGLTPEQITQENFMISSLNLIALIIIAFLTQKIHPLKLAKILLIPFVGSVIIGAYILQNSYTVNNLFIVRSLLLLFCPYSGLIQGISFMHVPILKRLTYVGLAFSLSNSIFYCTAPFVISYLIGLYNYWGLIILNIPLVVFFLWSIIYFEKLEKIKYVNSKSYAT